MAVKKTRIVFGNGEEKNSTVQRRKLSTRELQTVYPDILKDNKQAEDVKNTYNAGAVNAPAKNATSKKYDTEVKASDKQYNKLDAMVSNAREQAGLSGRWDEETLRLNRIKNDRGKVLDTMTDREQKVYLDLIQDKSKEDYVKSIRDDINQRIGKETAEYVTGEGENATGVLGRLGYSVGAGLSNFASGLEGAANAVIGKEGKVITRNPIEYAYQNIAPTVEEIEKMANGIVFSTANMLPSMAASVINPLVGTALMGLSSGGNSYDDAIRDGYSVNRARAYGAASGVKEAALQKTIGALPGINKAQSVMAKALSKYGDNIIGIVLKNEGVRKGFETIVGNALSEGGEEYAQEVLDGVLRNVFLGEDNDIKLLDKDAAYAGALGAISGGLFAGAGNVIQRVSSNAQNTTNNNRNNSNIIENNLNNVQNNEIRKEVMSSDTKKVKNLLTATVNEVRTFVNRALKGENKEQYLKISDVSERLKNDLAKVNINVDGFVHALKDNDIRHIENSHGSKSNEKYKVTEADYDKVADIIENYDTLYRGYDTKDGNTAIVYEKAYDNKMYYVEQVLEEGVLSTKQMMKVGLDKIPNFIKKYKKISSVSDTDVSEFNLNNRLENSSPPSNHVQNAETTAYNNIISPIAENINNVAEIQNVQPEIDITEAVKSLGKEGQKTLTEYYTKETSFTDFYNGFSRYYESGKVGLPFEQIETVYGGNISPEVQQMAYNSGAKDAKASIDRDIANTKAYTNGRFIAETAPETMSKSEKSFYEALAKSTGATIQFADSVLDGQANGQYVNGVITIAKDSEKPFYVVAKHEITHLLQEVSPVEYRAYRDYAVQLAEKENGSSKTIVEQYKGIYKTTEDRAMDEIAADFTERILTDKKALENFINDNVNETSSRNMVQKFFDAVGEFIEKIKNVFKGNKSKMDAAAEAEFGLTIDELEEGCELWVKALKKTEENVKTAKTSVNESDTNNRNVRYSINPNFASQIDAWMKLSDKDKAKGRFLVGTTSEALKSIGVKNYKIYWDRSSLLAKIKKHSELTADIVKQLPNVLEKPILILKSSTIENSITVWGEVYADDGKPIMVSVKLDPKSKTGVIYNYAVVTSAYKRPISQLQNFLNDYENILYLDGNKKRTDKWLQSLGLQLPPLVHHYGSLKMINQIDKSVNEESTEGVERFSLKKPVEETKSLVALHNLTENKLKKILELGGFPMPSIAVTKADIPHTNFGDITLVMDKSAIDPKADRKNVVYSADAWTPTFPRIEYEADDKAQSRISKKYYDLARKVGYDAVRPLYGYVNELERKIENEGGEQGIIESLIDNKDMMNVFLADSGKEMIEPIYKETVTRLNDSDIELYEHLINGLGEEAVKDFGLTAKDRAKGVSPAEKRKLWLDKYKDKLEETYRGYYENIGFSESEIDNVVSNNPYLHREVMKAKHYLQNGAETVKREYDSVATRKAIESAVNKTAYENWLKDLFKGVVKGAGVYNNKSFYTSAGDRRSFKETHYPVTLENIVKAMKGQNGGDSVNIVGFNGVKSLRAGLAERFKSIADMHEREGRLENLTKEQADTITEQLGDRLYSIIGRILKTSKTKVDNELIAMDWVGEYIQEIANGKKYTIDSIVKAFEGSNYKINNGIAAEIRDLLFDISQMPVHIFEAKPERVVGFDEVLAAIIPDDTETGFVNSLKDVGFNVLTYERDNEASRVEAVNFVEEAKFSLKESSDILKQNAALKEYNEYLKNQMKLTKEVKVDKKALNRLVNDIVKEYGTNFDKAELFNQLDKLYTRMQNEEQVTWEDVKEEALGIARNIVSDATYINDELYQSYKDLRDKLRTTGITLDKEYRASLSDSYNDFRKANFGRINLVNDGISVDSFYQELAGMYPEFFDDEEYTHPAEQLENIAEVLDSLRPYEENPYSYNLNNAAEWAAGDIVDRFFETALKKPTFADKQKAKLDKQKAKAKSVLKAEREKKKEAILKLKEKQKAKEARMSERRKRSVLISKIKKHIDKMNKMLLKPSETSYIPDILRKPAAELLRSINLETDRLGDKTIKRLDELKAAYEKILKEDSGFYMDVDPDLMDNIAQVLESVKGKEGIRLADMKLDDVNAFYRAVLAVERSIYSYNRVLSDVRHETVSRFGEAVIAENKTEKGYTESANRFKQRIADMLNMDMLAPADFFEELGADMSELWGNIRKGFDTKIRLTKTAIDYMNTLKGEAKIENWTGKKAKTTTFMLESGKEIILTPAQVMSLYLLDRQPDAQNHIYKGGIKPADVITKEGKLKKAKVIKSFDVAHVTQEDVSNIIKSLTDEQKKVAEGISKFFTDYTSKWGNEVSMKLYGYEKFGVENYFPIVSDKDYLTEVFAETNDTTLKNMGFTKNRQKGASNPIVLEDAFDVYARQADQMASYNAFVVPLNDIQKVYNYKNVNGGVKSAIRKKFGSRANAYFTKIMTDLNGGAQYGTDDFTSQLISNYKKAKLGLNLRVAIQQPWAAIRASAMIKHRYLVAAFGRGAMVDIKKVMKYAPIAQWKEWGFYSMDTGRSMQDLILEKKDLTDVIFWAAGWADRQAWKHLWKAVELETKAERKDLEVNSEEFYKAVGERFSEVIDKTQVVDSTLHRTQIMRSPNGITKMATSFMSEPMKSYNLVRTALRNMTEKNTPEAKKALVRTVIAYSFATIATSAAASIVDAARGDEDDEYLTDIFEEVCKKIRYGEEYEKEDRELDYKQRWFRHFIENAFGDPMGMIPYVKDLVSLFEGFSVERMDMQGIGDLIGAIKRLPNDKYTPAFKVIDISAKAGDVFGIPAGSVKRAIGTGIKSFLRIENNPAMEYDISKLTRTVVSNKSYYMDILYDALMSGIEKDYDYIVEDLINEGVKPKYIESAMRKRFNDDRDKGFEDFDKFMAESGIQFKFEVEEEDDDKFTIDNLSAKEYLYYSDLNGDTITDLVQEFERRGLGKLDEEAANTLLSAAYKYANQTALEEASKGEYEIETEWISEAASGALGLSAAEYIMLMEEYSPNSMTAKGIHDAYELGIEPEDYLEKKAVKDSFETIKDENGKKKKGVKEQFQEYLYDEGYRYGSDEFVLWMEVMGYKP